MLIVHHLENSRSQRVLWLLEELGVAYEVKRYRRTAGYRAPRALRAVHPLGKSPVVEETPVIEETPVSEDATAIGEGQGQGGATVRLAETGAIVEYILHRFGKGALMPPVEAPEYWTARHFMHHAEGTAMPPLVMRLVFGAIGAQAPLLMRPVMKAGMRIADARFLAPQLEALADYWETALAPTGWFAGSALSAADVMMSFPVEAGATRIDYAARPRLRDFLARIHARPAYARALERGGPYAFAG